MRALGLALALLAAGLSGCQNFTKLDLTTLGRGSWQRPEDVIEALAIAPGARVADVGTGEGYFVPYLVDAVGPEGRVFAVDVEREITDALEQRFADEPSVEVVLGGFEDPELPDGGLDLVLMVNTFHHIEDRPAYFARLRGDLSAKGRVAILEPNAELGGLLSLALDEGHKSQARDVVREMQAAGYRSAKSFDFLPVQIFEVFAPIQ